MQREAEGECGDDARVDAALVLAEGEDARMGW
jgi:hypothetical protein